MSAFDTELLAMDPAYARDNWVHAHIAGAGVTQKQAWDAAIRWVNETRTASPWGSLTEAAAVAELRRGSKSIYYPDFHNDGDVAWVDCPRDGRITVGVEGYCDACGYPFDDSPTIKEWD